MERVFKQKRAADSFAKKQRSKGLVASVFDEPIDPHGSTRRARARKRYIVQYDTGSSVMGPTSRQNRMRQRNFRKNAANPVRVEATVTGSGTGWINARAVKIRRSGKGFVVDVKR